MVTVGELEPQSWFAAMAPLASYNQQSRMLQEAPPDAETDSLFCLQRGRVVPWRRTAVRNSCKQQRKKLGLAIFLLQPNENGAGAWGDVEWRHVLL